MNRFFPLSVLLSLAGLSAQGTATFPSDHDPALISNGSSSSYYFPYSYGVSRVMLIYESWDLHVPAGHAIHKIGFRAEGTTLSYGQALQLEVRMGPTIHTAADAVSNFDNNYLSSPTTVFGPALFTMPDMNNLLNPNPDGNMIWLTLTTDYVPDLTNNLAVEWRVIGNNAGGSSFTYALDVGSFDSPIVHGSQVCPHSGGQTPQLRNRPTDVGGTWYTDLTRAPASQLAVLGISFGPIGAPTPLHLLLPGTQASCNVYLPLSGLFTVSGTTNSSGSLTWSVPVPNSRIPFNDLIITSQVLCADFFSPGGFVVSNADQMQIGIDPAMTLIYQSGNPATATAGSVQRHYGLVTSFAWL